VPGDRDALLHDALLHNVAVPGRVDVLAQILRRWDADDMRSLLALRMLIDDDAERRAWGAAALAQHPDMAAALTGATDAQGDGRATDGRRATDDERTAGDGRATDGRRATGDGRRTGDGRTAGDGRATDGRLATDDERTAGDGRATDGRRATDDERTAGDGRRTDGWRRTGDGRTAGDGRRADGGRATGGRRQEVLELLCAPFTRYTAVSLFDAISMRM
jgi:hypothetical protein